MQVLIVRPRIRGFICTTAHPTGCALNVQDQIAHVAAKGTISKVDNALVVGCSTGYGLASRIVSAFGCGANTLGVSLEKDPSPTKTASAGWYNNRAFDLQARNQGLFAQSLNGDAYSDEVKAEVVDTIKREMGQLDLLVYSLASPVRTHPVTGTRHRSVIKPLGKSLSSKTLALDVLKNRSQVVDIELEPATEEETANTVAVMGGEDWEFWVRELDGEGLLSESFKTFSYTYLGNELTWAIYRGGTLGKAKEDLDRACQALNGQYGPQQFEASVAVLKAVVTQASTAIPVVPLYFSILFDVMKEQGNHEDCIMHIYRLFREQFYGTDQRRIDADGRIRMDNFEQDDSVQDEVRRRWQSIGNEEIGTLADTGGFRDEFLRLFGFGRADVDYSADVDPMMGTTAS